MFTGLSSVVPKPLVTFRAVFVAFLCLHSALFFISENGINILRSGYQEFSLVMNFLR